jgi:glycosyltransferase involved in cell wall biosynthesis
MVYIITPCRRPLNLERMKLTIPAECQWVIVYDSSLKHEYNIEGAINLKSPFTGDFGNPNRNHALDTLKMTDDDWFYILDDDNTIHPDWYENIKNHLNSGATLINWGQEKGNGVTRFAASHNILEDRLDTAQYMMKWGAVKDIRYQSHYEADGDYVNQIARITDILTIDKDLCYYNYLRRHKDPDPARTHIVMISMFRNEAHNIRQMLESCYQYIDFWILQDNGSTDGTPEVVYDFFKDKDIPGFIYKVEEGWVGFGWNRDHLLQKCLDTDHGCDWILKMDCDETLEVDTTSTIDPDGFDWSIFWNTNIQSFDVVAAGGGIVYYRTWIWNAKLPWRFNHDTAHETIYLDVDYLEDKQAFERVALPKGFRQVGHNTGQSWSVPTKFLSDALIFEERLLRENTLLENRYHFFYIGKSYEDTYEGDFFPLGRAHSDEYARRCIFYFEEFVHQAHDFKNTGEAKHMDEMCYYALCGVARAYKFLGNIRKAIFYYQKSHNFCPRRNEHLIGLAESYNLLGEYNKMLEITNMLMSPERTCPFPDLVFLINTNLYNDTGKYPEYLYNLALEKNN